MHDFLPDEHVAELLHRIEALELALQTIVGALVQCDLVPATMIINKLRTATRAARVLNAADVSIAALAELADTMEEAQQKTRNAK